ncbi:response regulator [Streptomyces albidoflavus]|uniref:response regulator n=1 Tax=Streptomyces TaxID=1883 RepID=UPI00063E91FD|nr:response regulator [Streptomyces sp. KE1]KLJ04941.1 chemotaxis protein CheY [Streptomyces sp. KE1]
MIDVLVVDDDPRVARINAAYTDRVPGFRTAGTAHTTGQALTWLDGHHADLVLLDHYLPDENGLGLVRRLRAGDSRTDVIMVTAARDVATVEAAMRYGALHYLVKPFSYSGLRAKLEGYAVLRRTLADGPEAGQERVDRIFGVLGSAAAGPMALPKGHSAQTVRLVRQALKEAGQLSATGVADRTGLSRQTAQRYLKLLERSGQVGLTLRYTGSGRPEHVYTWTGTGEDA